MSKPTLQLKHPLTQFLFIMILGNMAFFALYLSFFLPLHGNIPEPGMVCIKMFGLALFPMMSFGYLLFPGLKTSDSASRKGFFSVPQRWGPLLLSFFQLISCLGNIIALLSEMHYINDTVWGNILPLGNDVLLLTILLLLIRGAHTSSSAARVMLDCLMVLTTLISLSWYFLLGPVIVQSHGDLLETMVQAAFPVMDLLLLSGVFFLLARVSDQKIRFTKVILVLSLLCYLIADTLYTYSTLQTGWIWQLVPQILWPISHIIMLIGTYSMRTPLVTARQSENVQKKERKEWRESFWFALAPYFLLPIMALLIILTFQHHDPMWIVWGVWLGALLLLTQLLWRQIMLLGERQHYADLLKRSNQQLVTLATTDPLTECLNQRAMIAIMNQELERVKRYERSCSLLFLDIDHFKALNDGYGHDIGDSVLKEFANLIRPLLRGMDTVGRWGGEEFVALLPEASLEDAREAAERIRDSVSRYHFQSGELHLTCSIGVATLPVHGGQREDLIKQADQAMYAAKRLGRNQVRCANDPEVLALLAQAQAGEGREQAAVQGMVDAMMTLAERRDTVLGVHSQEVASLVQRLAHFLGVAEEKVQMITLAARLHDIGKMALNDTILQKSSLLTEEERKQMHAHPLIGAEAINHIPTLRPLAPIIRGHHERWDGTGYPDQLAGEAIPFASRLIALSNAYQERLDTHHGYLSAHSARQEALAEVRRGAGTQFDPQLVTAFMALLEAEQAEAPLLSHIA